MERSLESGASIVEICMAILIVALTGIVIMMFTKNTFSSYRNSRVSEEAMIVAEEKLNQLDAAAIPSINGTDTVTLDKQRYIRRWEIKDTLYIKRVVVTVSFQVSGKNKNVKLTGAID